MIRHNPNSESQMEHSITYMWILPLKCYVFIYVCVSVVGYRPQNQKRTMRTKRDLKQGRIVEPNKMDTGS